MIGTVLIWIGAAAVAWVVGWVIYAVFFAKREGHVFWNNVRQLQVAGVRHLVDNDTVRRAADIVLQEDRLATMVGSSHRKSNEQVLKSIRWISTLMVAHLRGE